MAKFTPRTSKAGMSNSDSVYNNRHYVGGETTNPNSNLYNYNDPTTYQCTYYALGRSGEIAGEPVQSFAIAPNPNIKHKIFKKATGFDDANKWITGTNWETSEDKFKPKLGAIVCYNKYPNDGGAGHVQIIEKIEGNTIYVSQNQTAYSDNFLTAINVNDLTTIGSKVFQGYIYNPYIEDEPTPPIPPTPSLVDVIEFTNNNQYAYIEWDSSRKDSGYDYKLQLLAPLFKKAGVPNTVTDPTMGDWELIARINGGFFFPVSGEPTYASGIEKQHYTWNEQYDDTEYDNVLAIGSDGSDNTILSSGSTSSFRTFKGEWCLTGGTSLSGGARINGDVDSDTGHSFLGYNGRKIIMGVSKSGVSGAALRSKLTSMGYVGVELDGGGSTAFNYLGVDYNNTGGSRSVKNVICLYRKKKKAKKKLGRNDIRLDNSITVKALEVLTGKYGSGFIRKHKLGKEYYDVQYQINYLIHNYHLYELLAFEVLVGIWGNGRTRKRKLEAKGYNYYKVQAYVNMYKDKNVL